MKPKPILIVDDEPSMRMALSESLRSCGYDVETARDGADALRKFNHDKYGVVITDMRMPKVSGMEVLRGIKKDSVRTPVIVITAYGTVNTAVEAMKEGASDFIMKPFSLEHLENVVKNVVSRNNASEREAKPQETYLPERKIITRDEKMIALLDMMKNISGSKSSVLIQGESGTGKELLARYIHQHSIRKGAPFVAVNCAAIPDNLLESEMFGYEKGAFTGANQKKMGKFELADRGTLLLDEISEMNFHLQTKLLRAVQEGEIDRLGGNSPVPIDVRIIATTNTDLKKNIEEKNFRADLYYRLNVIPVKIPPLRERKSDITILGDYFLEKYSRLNSMEKPTLSPDTCSVLESYDWPGNIRELENVIERSILVSGGYVIKPEHLYLETGNIEIESGKHERASMQNSSESCDIHDGATLREMERDLILRTLDSVNGNKTQASKILGISVRTMRNKLNEYKDDGWICTSEN